MITWFVAALVCATSLAQQSQGLVSQSTLLPPNSAGSTDQTDVKTKAAVPVDAPKPATAKKSEPETKTAKTSPPAEVPKVAQGEMKPAAGARVAAFWFMLPRK